jgi:SAM-dependent methyltransferase
VLDLGCGTGRLAVPLASVAGSVDAVDLNRDALNTVTARAREAGLSNLRTYYTDARAFGSDRAYDVVVVSEVFPFVPQPERLAANIARLLAPDGLLIATITNGHGPYQLFAQHLSPRSRLRRSNLLRKAFGKSPYERSSGKEFVNAYTRDEFLSLLQSTMKLRLVAFSTSDGPLAILGNIYNRSERLGEINVRLADILPPGLASGWMFALRRV